MRIYTIGHSTHPIDEFIGMLRSFDIETLVDIRTIPKSRYNPQFSQENLSTSLGNANIKYLYMKDLGGLRKARKDSPNGGWRNSSFRGYADYMLTPEFQTALEELISIAGQGTICIMCAESVPWRCHRSLVADALTLRDIEAVNIMGTGKFTPHKLNKMAKPMNGQLLYPPETEYLPGLSV